MKRQRFQYLPLDQIDVSLSNVRKKNLEEGIDELARSIQEIGVQQPVVVFEKKNGRPKRYELIIGQRRYLACHKAKEPKIPALITKIKDKTDALIRSFSENIHRLDLDYRDKMQVATELLQRFHTITEVSRQLGVSRQTVKRYLGYSAVPEDIKKLVDEGKINPTTAIEIVQNIDDEKRAIEVAVKVKELPRSQDKRFFIEVAGERTDKSTSEAFQVAKRRSEMRSITIHVTKKVYNALKQASQKYDLEIEWVVKEAVDEWLKKERLL